MKKFDINDYKGGYVMHCETEEEAVVFLNYLDSVGKKWCTGESYEITRWGRYKKYSAYDFNRGKIDGCLWYRDNGYTILKFSDFNWEDEEVDKKSILFNKMEELKQTMQQEIDKIKKEIEELDKPKNPMMRVEECEKYFYVCDECEVIEDTEDKNSIDNNRFEHGNYFNSRDIAQKEANFRKARGMLLKWKYEHDNVEIDWSDENRKYFLMYFHDTQLLGVDHWCGRESSTITFSNRPVLEQFIEKHGDEYCKLMWFTK